MIIAAIRYHDPDTAIGWLLSAFGLEPKEVHRDDNGAIVHAELRLGAGLMMLGQYSEDGFLGAGRPDPPAGTISLYAVIEDPDRHYEQAKAAGAQIVRELVDQPYGSREYSARDLEGNLWSFGTYDPR